MKKQLEEASVMKRPVDHFARCVLRTQSGLMAATVLCALTVLAPSTSAAAKGKIPVDEEAEAKLLAAAGEGFQLKRTAHFAIAYDTDADTLREFIARVEATHRAAYRFLKHHDIALDAPQRRLEILFFSHVAGFQAYARSIHADATGAAGFYHPASNRAAFYDAASMPRLANVNRRIKRMEEKARASRGRKGARRDALLKQLRILRNERDNTIESVNQLVVQHEVAHQVFFNAGLHARDADQPLWIVEGLACLFETPPSSRGAGMGAVNQYRLLSLREALAGRDGAKKATSDDYFAAIRADRLTPLRRLLADKGLFDTKRPDVEQSYALAWSLVYFLQHRERDKLGDYLTVLAHRPSNRGYTGKQELQLFEASFGSVDETFERRWIDYILSLRLRVAR